MHGFQVLAFLFPLLLWKTEMLWFKCCLSCCALRVLVYVTVIFFCTFSFACIFGERSWGSTVFIMSVIAVWAMLLAFLKSRHLSRSAIQLINFRVFSARDSCGQTQTVTLG